MKRALIAIPVLGVVAVMAGEAASTFNSRRAQDARGEAGADPNGESIGQAIVIKGEGGSAEAVERENEWILTHHPGSRKVGQALLRWIYDEIEIQLADGKTKKIYFDITECFGFPEGEGEGGEE